MAQHTTTTTTSPTADNDAGDDPDEPGSSTGEAHQRNAVTETNPGKPGASVSLWCRRHAEPPEHERDVQWVRDQLTRAIAVMGCTIERVDVVIVDDDEIRRLNREFHDADHATDVLSFQQSDPGAAIETDIAISYDTAVREADRYGHEVRRELLLYALHGLLHCCGYNDSTDVERDAMHREEDRILESIGVGAVYETNSGSDVSARRDDRPPSGGNSHS